MTPDPFDMPKLAPVPEPTEDDRPVVQFVKGEAHLAVQDAIVPLAESGLAYKRGNRLVQVVFDMDMAYNDHIERDEYAQVIQGISPGHLWEILAQCISWRKYDGRAKKLISCEPPGKVVSAMHSRGHWAGMPVLKGVSTVPILREDGSVHVEPGYDAESGLFYAPNSAEPEIPGSPTLEDAKSSISDILDIVSEFPFVEEKHRSAWLSTVFSGLARPVITGGVPMTVVDANTPGTGKSLLVDVTSMLVSGTMAPRSPPVRDEEEFRKAITSFLYAGDLICLIDNMPSGRPIGWSVLDNAITAGTWADRELGRTNILKLPMRALFFITGNNLSISADTARRTIRVRLESSEPNPENRSGFKWDPILERIREERPFLLGKALNAVRAYMLAGRPDVGTKPIGSFESWSSVVRNAIIWLGLEDPAEAFATKEEGVDEEHEARCTILADWHHVLDVAGPRELTVSEFLEQVDRRKADCRDLVDAIGVLCPTRDGSLPTARRMGWTFRSMCDRVHLVSGHRMELKKFLKHNITHWYVKIHEQCQKDPTEPTIPVGSEGKSPPLTQDLGIVIDNPRARGETGSRSSTSHPDFEPDEPPWYDDLEPDESDGEVPF